MESEFDNLIFSGHSRHTLDEKGRVAVPKSFRKVLPSESNGRVKLCIGHDSTIDIHPLSEWKRSAAATLSQLDEDVPEDRDISNAKFWSAEDAELDQANRILIPRYMQEYAGLKPGDECVFVGKGFFFGLLSAVRFDEKMKRYMDKYDEYTNKKKTGGPENSRPAGNSEASGNGK